MMSQLNTNFFMFISHQARLDYHYDQHLGISRGASHAMKSKCQQALYMQRSAA